MRRTFASASALSLCFALSALGCSSESSGTNDQSSPDGSTSSSASDLTVLSWWVAPGEAEALQALIDTYKTAYPKVRVTHDDNISASTWKDVISAGIDHPT
jgi:ABC-type glycerol-3-phosphate transport system substrate-binding protein